MVERQKQTCPNLGCAISLSLTTPFSHIKSHQSVTEPGSRCTLIPAGSSVTGITWEGAGWGRMGGTGGAVMGQIHLISVTGMLGMSNCYT